LDSWRGQSCLMTRRQLLGTGASAAAVAALCVTPSLFTPSRIPYRTIYDERFEAGKQFALEAHARGWPTRAIRGDVTYVWFHDLAVRWRQGPAAIAGLTTHESLFVLERLAWDAGMRVIERDSASASQLIRWHIS
jgi:hypothetical protein